MKNIIIYSIISFVLFSMTSCKKDIDITTQTEVGIPPVVEFKGSLAGIVTDIRGNALANVVVDVNGQTTTTDEEGIYILDDIWLNQNGTLVSFSKSEFFDAHKIFNTASTSRQYLNVSMGDRQAIVPINSDMETQLNVYQSNSTEVRASVKFQANSFLTSSGDPYLSLIHI